MNSVNRLYKVLTPRLMTSVKNHFNALVMRGERQSAKYKYCIQFFRIQPRFVLISPVSMRSLLNASLSSWIVAPGGVEQPSPDGADAWSSFTMTVGLFESSMTTLSHLVLLARTSREMPVFFLMCVAKPIASMISVKSLWNTRECSHNNIWFR